MCASSLARASLHRVCFLAGIFAGPPLLRAWMTSPAGSSRDTSGPAAQVDTTNLDKLCEKALTADVHGRYALAATFHRRAAGEALCLHGETFVCTFLTLQCAASLVNQSLLEGVARDEKIALQGTLTSSALPLIVRRMDANTMLPGRGTAAELAFYKWYAKKKTTLKACSSLLGLVSVTNRLPPSDCSQ